MRRARKRRGGGGLDRGAGWQQQQRKSSNSNGHGQAVGAVCVGEVKGRQVETCNHNMRALRRAAHQTLLTAYYLHGVDPMRRRYATHMSLSKIQRQRQ